MRPSALLTSALLATLASSPAPASADARAPDMPVVDLLTMGPGHDVFEAFGHASLCITDAQRPQGECYNYGYTDFDDVPKLVATFIRGRAKFWAQPQAMSWVLETYAKADRDVYKQRLPLTADAARALAAALERDLLPENRYYFYHHFRDNCTTRLRDHIDRAVGGALSRGADVPVGSTFRQLARKGYAGSLRMLLAVDFILGEPADHAATVWQAMFLPDVLRTEVQRRLGVAPEMLHKRKGKPYAAGKTWLAQWFLFMLGLALGAVAFASTWHPRFLRRAALVVVGVVSGLLGVALYVLAVISVMPELRKNELMLVFLPTDLALIVLGGRALFLYLFVRIGLLVLVALASIAGILVQPLLAPVLIPLLPMAIFAGHAIRQARERTLLMTRREGSGDERSGAPAAAARRSD